MPNSKITEQTELFECMKRQAIVVTPNNRIANQLMDDYAAHFHQIVYDKPLCMSFDAFLTRLFQRVRHTHANQCHPMVLTAFQQQVLWKKILNENADFSPSDGLLHEVQSASTTCRNWQVDIHSSDFAQTPQTQQFQTWQLKFDAMLESLNAITPDQLAEYITPFAHVLHEKVIIWVCFNEFTPQQKALQQAFQEQGCQSLEYELSNSGESSQYPAHDAQDEWTQMMLWVQSRLDAGDGRIGIVVPELQTHARSLTRFIRRFISEELIDLSLGEPLSHYPMVAHALTFLDLNKNTLSNEDARLLLSSPHLFCSKSEFYARSKQLHESKLLQENLISYREWIKELEKTTPKLAQTLQTMEPYPASASVNEWRFLFKSRLKALGFPGEYSLSSASFQCAQRLELLFDEFATLEGIYGQLNQQQALECLQHLVSTTIFQLQKTKTPVIVAGLLEASGCTFDSVWVCGLDDQCLPQKTRLSPFLPMTMQRVLHMPRALPENELKFAEALITRLQNGCQRIVFSYPKLISDRPSLPCPLISNHPHHPPFPIPTSPINPLISTEESFLIPVIKSEKITGGTALLGNQAKCPFRAFAAHRLHAKKARSISAGPDASERGQVVHKIMERFWQQVRSQKTLLTLSDTDIDHILTPIILETLTPIRQLRRFSFPSLMQDVEFSRLKKLVGACLEWEKTRPAFEVEATEKTFHLGLGGIDFQVRLDRLDTVGADKWVIDYKSTIPAAKPWNAERPEEPQLLLYALLDEDINAFMFIQLKAGKLVCSGLSEEAFEVTGLKGLKKDETWSDMRSLWQRQLTALAEEFFNGQCPPKPARTSLCQQCDFPALCRVDLS